MSTERRVAKNTAWLVLQPLAMNVLSLAATGYIARALGSTEMGRFNLGYAFVALLAPLTNLGIRSLTIRHVAQNRDSAAGYLGRVLVLRTLLALLGALVLILAAPMSGGGGQTRAVIAIAALGMVVTTAVQVLTDGFQAFEIMRPASVATFGGGLILTLMSVIVIRYGGGIREMALAYALGPVCTLALLCVWLRRQPFCPRLAWDPVAFRLILKEAAPFFMVGVLDALSSRAGVMVTARLVSGAMLGCYTVALGLVDRSLTLSDGAGTALMPAIARVAAESPAEAVPLLRKSTLWLTMLSVPIAVFTTALSPLIVRVIFGAQYAAAAPLLAVGIWRLPINCLMLIETRALYAAKRQDLVLRICAIGMAVSLVFLLPLTYYYGALGGMIALGIRPTVTLVLGMRARAAYFPSIWSRRESGRLALALALMCLPLGFMPVLGSGWRSLLVVPPAIGIYLTSLAMLKLIPLEAILRGVSRRVVRAAPALRWAVGQGEGND